MQEKNRHILIKGIKDMPEHEPPFGLWENIEITMLPVPVDILPVHELPASAWTAIEAGIGRSSFSRKSFYRIISIALLIFLLGGAAIIYFNGNNFITPKHPEKLDSGPTIIMQEDIKKEETKIGEEDKSIQDTKDPLILKLPQGDGSQNYSQKKQAIKESAVKNNTDKTISQFDRDLDLIILKPINGGFITYQHKTEAGGLGLTNSYHIHNDNPAMNDDPFNDCNFFRPEQKFYISPGFEYQHFLNSIEPENVKLKYWYSVDLSVLFQRNRFSVETGLGIGFSKDKIDFSYNYLTNELIHTYVYVDSIYYDPITGTTQYFTTTVDVYDSIPYSKQTSSETKYTYLQIPLELGYEILKNEKYSLCIKAGITYFTEINRKETRPDIYHENSRITSYNSYEIIRKKEFFRMSGGLEFRWGINSKLRFTAKPTFNYFFNQIYDNEYNRENPIALGIRFGLYYKF